MREQSAASLSITNHHHIRLEQAITSPQRISVIVRTVAGDHVEDEILNVWLVGHEGIANGYRIVMRDDGKQFGLSSSGFAGDKHLILVGWYGDLLSAFLAM